MKPPSTKLDAATTAGITKTTAKNPLQVESTRPKASGSSDPRPIIAEMPIVPLANVTEQAARATKKAIGNFV